MDKESGNRDRRHGECPRGGESARPGKGKILIVDEDVRAFQTLVEILSVNDFEVIWAQTGNDGIRLAETAEPDVILLNMHLGDINSLDVCRNLRLRNSTWSIPVILVTARQLDETQIARGLELGANDCVSKPFKKLELLGRIGVLMRMKRVEDKLRRLYIERTRELEWSNMELQKIRTRLILQNQMSRLGLMVSVVAHEIRSPAASISGNLDLAGSLLTQFVDGLTAIPDVFREAAPEDVMAYYQLLRIVAQTNLREAPIEIPRRRQEEKKVDRQIRMFLPEGLDENTTRGLAKFRIGQHLNSLGPLLVHYGPGIVTPLLELGELLVKLKNMTISIKRINGIVRAMKAYSHVDRSELQEVDIHEGLDDTLTIMNYIFRGSVEIIKEYASELPKVQGYPGELNQVWTNLLQNAYDAMGGGKGRIRVRTSLETISEGRAVVVRVFDNGKGIPREILPYVFESFFTTKEKGKGSGLGLDICKQIIERHQGSIDVFTEPGETVFSVFLPVERKRDEL